MIDKIRSLSKDTLIYGVNTIVGRFLNFLLVPYYTNKFLPEEYGVIALIYSYIALFNVFFSLGLESGYMRFASLKETGTERENFSNPYIVNAVNSLFLGLLLFAFSGGLAGILQIDAKYSYLLKYAAAILVLDSVSLIPFASLRLANMAGKFVAFKVTNIVINVVLNILLISYYDMGIEAVLISNLISSFVSFVLVFPVVLKSWTFSWNRQLVTELMKFSLPYIPTGIAANLVQVVDRPILKMISDDSTVGVYQANYKLGIFMLLIVSMFEYAWRPFFLNNAKDENAKWIFTKVMTAFVFAASAAVLALSVFIEDIVKADLPFGFHLIGKDYWGGLGIVPIILFSYIFYGIYINLTAGIYIEKKTSYLPVITVVAAALNISFIYILYPLLGLTGAALATLISYVAMSGGIYYVSNKYYPVPYEAGKIAVILLSMVAVYAAYKFLDGMFHVPVWMKFIVPVIYILILHFFKVVDISALKRLIGR